MKAPSHPDVENFYDLASIFWRRKVLWFLILVLGTAGGIGTGFALSRYYLSYIPLEFVPESVDVISKAPELNAALCSLFSRPAVARQFSKTFLAEVDRLAASAGPHQVTAQRVRQKWTEAFSASSNRASVEVAFAAYLSGDMVVSIKQFSRLSRDVFRYVIYAPDDNLWSVYLQTKETGLSTVVGMATAAALSPAIEQYNAANTKSWQDFRVSRAMSYIQMFQSLQGSQITQAPNAEETRVRVWQELSEIEQTVDKREGSKMKGQLPKQSSVVLAEGSLSEIAGTVDAMRINPILIRLSALREKNAISEDEFQSTLKRLNQIVTTLTTLSALSGAQEASLAIVPDTSKNVDAKEHYLLANVRYDDTLLITERSMAKLDQRTLSIRKWAAGSLFMATLFATALVLVIELGRSFVARMREMNPV